MHEYSEGVFVRRPGVTDIVGHSDAGGVRQAEEASPAYFERAEKHLVTGLRGE